MCEFVSAQKKIEKKLTNNLKKLTSYFVSLLFQSVHHFLSLTNNERSTCNCKVRIRLPAGDNFTLFMCRRNRIKSKDSD